MSKDIDRLMQMIVRQQGRVTTKEVEAYGFRREVLGKMVKEGRLIREARGVYLLPDALPDIYVILQHSCSKAVFSYETALWMHGVIRQQPDMISLTVQQGSNITRLKKNCTNLDVHYVQASSMEMGVEQMASPLSGKTITVYNKERCICDLVRSHHYKSREQQDIKSYTQALKIYFAGPDKNLQRLQQYAHRYGIEDQIYSYMEFLM